MVFNIRLPSMMIHQSGIMMSTDPLLPMGARSSGVLFQLHGSSALAAVTMQIVYHVVRAGQNFTFQTSCETCLDIWNTL